MYCLPLLCLLTSRVPAANQSFTMAPRPPPESPVLSAPPHPTQTCGFGPVGAVRPPHVSRNNILRRRYERAAHYPSCKLRSPFAFTAGLVTCACCPWYPRDPPGWQWKNPSAARAHPTRQRRVACRSRGAPPACREPELFTGRAGSLGVLPPSVAATRGLAAPRPPCASLT